MTDPAAAGQPPAHFQSQPLGRDPVGCFSVRRLPDSTRMIQIWALYRQSGSDRLEKQPTDLAAARTSFATQHSSTRPAMLSTANAALRRSLRHRPNAPRSNDLPAPPLRPLERAFRNGGGLKAFAPAVTRKRFRGNLTHDGSLLLSRDRSSIVIVLEPSTGCSACERFLLVLVVVIGQFHGRFFRVVQ